MLDGTHGSEPTLGAWLERSGFGRAFIEDHLLPMAAAIWSCPTAVMLDFPLISFLRFFRNHGLLSHDDRPVWRTVTGGSREYVRRLAAPFADRIRMATPVRGIARAAGGVIVSTDTGSERFDRVVVATHGDQAIRLLADADNQEQRILGAFRTQANIGYLHSDADLMPRRRRVWSSWNYLGDRGGSGERRVFVTYWMNRLQNLDTSLPVFLTLNPTRMPRERLIQPRATSIRSSTGTHWRRRARSRDSRGGGAPGSAAAIAATAFTRTRSPPASPRRLGDHRPACSSSSSPSSRRWRRIRDMHSALYVGEVMHHRLRPSRHRFVYRTFSLLVDLDELPDLDRRLRLFAHNRAGLLSIHDRDHGAADGTSPRAWVEAALAKAGLADSARGSGCCASLGSWDTRSTRSASISAIVPTARSAPSSMPFATPLASDMPI